MTTVPEMQAQIDVHLRWLEGHGDREHVPESSPEMRLALEWYAKVCLKLPNWTYLMDEFVLARTDLVRYLKNVRSAIEHV